MNKRANKIWIDACKEAEKEKGYVPAELLAIPTLIKLAAIGEIEFVYDKELDMSIIKSKKKTKVD